MSTIKPQNPIKIFTHEPSLINKILQLYWIIPKSWRLEEFSVNGDEIVISTKDGKKYTGLVSETCIKYAYDSYKHLCIYVSEKTNPKNKIHFKEIPGVLEDGEWESLVNFCKQVIGMEETLLGKITGSLQKIRDSLE